MIRITYSDTELQLLARIDALSLRVLPELSSDEILELANLRKQGAFALVKRLIEPALAYVPPEAMIDELVFGPNGLLPYYRALARKLNLEHAAKDADVELCNAQAVGWWVFYKALVDQGFTADQAMTILMRENAEGAAQGGMAEIWASALAGMLDVFKSYLARVRADAEEEDEEDEEDDDPRAFAVKCLNALNGVSAEMTVLELRELLGRVLAGSEVASPSEGGEGGSDPSELRALWHAALDACVERAYEDPTRGMKEIYLTVYNSFATGRFVVPGPAESDFLRKSGVL